LELRDEQALRRRRCYRLGWVPKAIYGPFVYALGRLGREPTGLTPNWPILPLLGLVICFFFKNSIFKKVIFLKQVPFSKFTKMVFCRLLKEQQASSLPLEWTARFCGPINGRLRDFLFLTFQ
jgi:hypothetical protein